MKSRWSILLAVMTNPLVSMEQNQLISIEAFPVSGIGKWWREDTKEEGLYRILRYEKDQEHEVKTFIVINKEKKIYGIIYGPPNGNPITTCTPEILKELSAELFQRSYPEDNPLNHSLFTLEERQLTEKYRGEKIEWTQEPVQDAHVKEVDI